MWNIFQRGVLFLFQIMRSVSIYRGILHRSTFPKCVTQHERNMIACRWWSGEKWCEKMQTIWPIFCKIKFKSSEKHTHKMKYNEKYLRKTTIDPIEMHSSESCLWRTRLKIDSLLINQHSTILSLKLLIFKQNVNHNNCCVLWRSVITIVCLSMEMLICIFAQHSISMNLYQ